MKGFFLGEGGGEGSIGLKVQELCLRLRGSDLGLMSSSEELAVLVCVYVSC